MTPGCTTEAMQFRDLYAEFEAADAVIFGVSRDNLASHDKFRTHLELPFDLIADTEEKLCHMFGVVKNKIMYWQKGEGHRTQHLPVRRRRSTPSGVARHQGCRPRRRSSRSRTPTLNPLNIGLVLPIWRLHRRRFAMRQMHHASLDTTAFGKR
jgi:Peroxiredoxin